MDLLRSPYSVDVPKVFKVETAHGRTKLMGAYARIIEQFANYMNYTLELVDEENFKMSQAQKKINNNFYNISIQTCSHWNRFADIEFSYPLDWSSTCIMVPAEDELPRFWYIVRPFGPYIWLFLFITMLCVAFVMTHLKHPTNSFCNNLLHSMALIIYSPSSSLCLVNIPLRVQLFYTLLFVLGFIMSSYYCSFLTVYNMKPLFQPYINTIEDILAVNKNILISSNMLEELKNNKNLDLLPLAHLLQETNTSDVISSTKNLNRSHAYVVSSIHWNLMTKLQKNLIQPIYQYSNICFGHAFNTYPIQANAKFAQSLQIFILLCKESGLWKYWQEEAFLMILNNEMYTILLDSYPVEPLAVSYYRIAWIIYIGGVTIACISFAFEIILYSYKHKIEHF